MKNILCPDVIEVSESAEERRQASALHLPRVRAACSRLSSGGAVSASLSHTLSFISYNRTGKRSNFEHSEMPNEIKLKKSTTFPIHSFLSSLVCTENNYDKRKIECISNSTDAAIIILFKDFSGVKLTSQVLQHELF